MISFFMLVAQGALMGYVAGIAFPGTDGILSNPAFWIACVINSVSVALYGALKRADM